MLWLWCRPGGAAPIRPLAGELPYAMGLAQKRKKKKKKREIISNNNLDEKEDTEHRVYCGVARGIS